MVGSPDAGKESENAKPTIKDAFKKALKYTGSNSAFGGSSLPNGYTVFETNLGRFINNAETEFDMASAILNNGKNRIPRQDQLTILKEVIGIDFGNRIVFDQFLDGFIVRNSNSRDATNNFVIASILKQYPNAKLEDFEKVSGDRSHGRKKVTSNTLFEGITAEIVFSTSSFEIRIGPSLPDFVSIKFIFTPDAKMKLAKEFVSSGTNKDSGNTNEYSRKQSNNANQSGYGSSERNQKNSQSNQDRSRTGSKGPNQPGGEKMKTEQQRNEPGKTKSKLRVNDFDGTLSNVFGLKEDSLKSFSEYEDLVEAISKARKALALKYHPDITNNNEYLNKIQTINAAYDKLVKNGGLRNYVR